MQLDNGNETSFFKILWNESAEYIQVPTPFAKKCFEKGNNDKKKLQTVVLKTKSTHDEWNVQLLKTKDAYYFADGWLKFKKDNLLQELEVLVFFLRSRSPKLAFEVFSYATNGCQKSLSSRSNKFPKTKTEIGCDDSLKIIRQNVLERAIKKSCINQVPLTKSFVKGIGIEGLCDLKLENDEGKIWEANLKNWGKFEVPYIATGWADFVKDNKLKVGNRCRFSHVKDNILHVHVIKRTKARKRLREPSTSRKHEVAGIESEKADDSARKFSSDNPHYRVRITDSYVRSCGVNANAGFCRRYLTYDKKCVTCVLHSDGKNYGEVQCKAYPNYTRLSGKNWKKFSDENHLAAGDECVFELINKNNENVLKVTIIRGRGNDSGS